jgi:DNA ligase D-like protein (predicted 3'-phosphoesterase)
MSLNKYKNKRDFKKTTEPEGQIKEDKEKVFVVQKHDASRLHYDFRLQIEGVLKSWAIPKGPSLDPSKKRLAIPTEDHPIDYADFEGIISENNYGAGRVIVWDIGNYENKTEKNGKIISIKEAYDMGHIKLILNGIKLKGEFALVKMKGSDKWLLIKKDDSFADRKNDVLEDYPKSVLSDKSIDEL